MDEGEINMDSPAGLIATLVQKNYDDYAASSQRLIDSLTYQLSQAQATLALVRAGVSEALSGPYMPNSFVVHNALWPSLNMIQREMESEKPAS